VPTQARYWLEWVLPGYGSAPANLRISIGMIRKPRGCVHANRNARPMQ